MKTTWTILSVALAASLLAVEAQAADFARKSHSTGSVGNTNISTGNNFHQGNPSSSALKSSGQLLVRQNGTSDLTKLAPLSAANKFNTVAAKNTAVNLNLNHQGNLSSSALKSSGQLLVRQNGTSGLTKLGTLSTANKFNTIAAKNVAGKLNLNQETTTGINDPRTGQDLSKDANPGFGLPGGKDISKEFPSAEQQWNDRLKGTFAGGSDYLGDGTPFDDKPGSNPMDDFLGQHGGNIPDPLAAYGSGRSGFSPANDAPADADPDYEAPTVDSSGGTSATNEEITLHSMLCGSDIIGKENIGKAGDDCIVIEIDGKGNFDTKMVNDFLDVWEPKPKDSGDQQYEGEGGYTGGSGHSVNDLYIGSIGRMTGKVVGGYDPGEVGVGKDTGGRLPAQFEAIGKYVSRGGKVHGKAGYQSGDSGHGQDIGGAAENNISGLKKAIDAQRFIIDPNARSDEEIPWWLREKVSPQDKASTAQLNAVQAGLEQGVSAQQNEAAK
jgi:hypothetical protein